MLGQYLKAALVFVMASAASAQTIIYMDYTSNFSTVLPQPQVNAQQDSMTYNTNKAGSYRFGVDWNQDATDMVCTLHPYISTTPAAILQPHCALLTSSPCYR